MVRALGALLALSMMLLLTAQHLHMVLIEHDVCQAHGELTHAGEGHHTESRVSDESDGVFATVGQDTRDESHDHCATVATESVLCESQRSGDLTVLPSFELPTPLRDQSDLSRRYRLLLAPKTSPPV